MAIVYQITNQNVCDIWCLATEFQDAYKQLLSSGCVASFEIKPTGSGQIWVRGLGLYTLNTKVINTGGPILPAQFKVSNSNGTYAKWYPDWDAPNMPGGWLANDTLLNIVALVPIKDEQWLMIEKNKGWVDMCRTIVVPPPIIVK